MSPSPYSISRSWRTTTYVMLLISLTIFLLQRTSWAMFDAVFEVCIFHIPTLFSSIIYLRVRKDDQR